MNVLTLIPTINRKTIGKEIEYLEIYVDGSPLQHIFAGRLGSIPEEISPLGWQVLGAEIYVREQARRFLLLSPPDLPNERNSILVCPIDGDLGCNTFSAQLIREETKIIWSEFGTENNWNPESVDLETYCHLPPLVFDWEQYEMEFLRHCNL